jgi:hypothetical protein
MCMITATHQRLLRLTNGGHCDVLQQLLRAKAAVDTRASDGACWPAFTAAVEGRADVLRVLVEAKSDLGQTRNSRRRDADYHGLNQGSRRRIARTGRGQGGRGQS